MAYLNVRERRIETKIAYIGPELAGKTTNLEQLTKSDPTRGRPSGQLNIEQDEKSDTMLESIEWRPRMERFNDCDIAVKLVAPHGALSTDRLDGILEGVDGVVVVVDSAPSAREENRRALSLVREMLKSKPTRPPVVVQWNKRDLLTEAGAEEGDEAATMTSDVDVDWPVVKASAARGEGVVETLEAALAGVLESMKKRRAPLREKMDQNPLLSALRDILRETVSEHMARVTEEVATRVAEEVRASMRDTQVSAREVQAAMAEMRTVMTSVAKETARAFAAQQEAIAELQRAIGDAETRAKEDAVTRVRADREHMTSIGTVIKRGVESANASMMAEAKKQEARTTAGFDDLKDKHVKMGAELATLQATVDTLSMTVESIATSLEPTAATINKIPARIGVLETSLQRELRDGVFAQLKRIEDSVHVMHVETDESLRRSEQRAGELHVGLNEILEDWKRRKKGWFSS